MRIVESAERHARGGWLTRRGPIASRLIVPSLIALSLAAFWPAAVLAQAPAAFVRLFQGANMGKSLVRLADETI